MTVVKLVETQTKTTDQTDNCSLTRDGTEDT